MISACPACVATPLATEIAASPDATVTLSVPDLHCAACIRTVESALNAIAGVRDARVNLSLRRVQAVTDIAPDVLIAALARAGFTAYAFDSDILDAQTDKTRKDLLLRLGVAGFAMMNVMLLSVAVWSGAAGATRDLFHLISAAIALPSVAYAAQPFFRNAWQALRVWRLNMDVPISLAIILAGGMSLYEALNGGEHAYFDAALSLTFFLLIGRVLEYQTRAAARSAARELSALEVRTATRRRGSQVETVPLSAIAVGDIVLVPSGVRVPVDGALLTRQAYTDRSFLTGESDPVDHVQGALLRAGEINVGPLIEMCAEAIGDETSLRRIAALVETAENARNRYTALADRAARIYAPAVHLLAALTFAGWIFATGDVRHALNVAIAVLIITCPCALGLAVPAVSTAAIGRLFELGFLVKSGTALERLAEVETIVFDKTGTLTRPGFEIEALSLSLDEKRVVKPLAQSSAHPLSRALDRCLDKIEPANVEAISETAGCGVSGRYAGQEVRLGHASWIGARGRGLALQIGERVIDLPNKEKLAKGAKALQNPIAALRLETQIVSGDNAGKTATLANKLNIPSWFAEMSTEDKQMHIKAISRRKPVCMVGDGINDTAALATAHASVAPGTALDAARNAADVLLIKDTLADLPALFAISRYAVRLSRQNFFIAGLYNLIAIPVAMAGFATPLIAALVMSISSLTVLLNALRIRWAT